MAEILKAPFQWFGGKSRVADLAWARFGDVPNYVEPFFGSGAVLLGRPHEPRIETVNDLDCYLANFWRALAADPDTVTHYADWPVNEADLHARHEWLVHQDAFRERMHADPDYHDPKIAGWWVWGLCQWIGSGWCGDYARTKDGGTKQQRPNLGNAGRGVHRSSCTDLHDYMRALAARLRRVRVCCGDWTRVLGPSSTTHLGLTAIFLDPPYSHSAGRDNDLYAQDHDVAAAVRDWAVAHGNDPLLRIALCGYEGEHDMPANWECVPWKAHGGMAFIGNGKGRENKYRERIYFSPHCLRPASANLFAEF